jgi:glycerophosphoryl diester phosphodiesterase
MAHRGAGTLAPENTMAAFERGASLGFAMFECDVQISADGVPFLLHDLHLSRTTNGHGLAADQTWTYLQGLDAGIWHSSEHQGLGLLRLDQLAHWGMPRGLSFNLEIKPAPGRASLCGAAVARAARDLWVGGACPPLLSSFSAEALQAAQAATPELPRAWLLDAASPLDWLCAHDLGCVAVVLHHSRCSASVIAQAHHLGLRALAYTVNDAGRAEQLQEWGVDGIITDAVQAFRPAKTA